MIKDRHAQILEAIFEKFGKEVWTTRDVKAAGIPLNNGALISLRSHKKITPVDEKGEPRSRAYTRMKSKRDDPQRWRIIERTHVNGKRR